MHRTAGGLPADVFIQEGKTALDPQNCFVGRIRRLNDGEKDTTFLLDLIGLARYADDNVLEKALSTYWTVVPESQLSSRYNWERFKAFDNSINSLEYKYVNAHKDEFVSKYTEDEVTKTLLQKAANTMQHAIETSDEKLMKEAKAILDKSNMDDVIKYGNQSEMMFYKSTGDTKTFRKLGLKYVNKYAKNNAEELNYMAFQEANGVDDPDLLKDAEKWAEQSIKVKKGYANMDTYAHVLYRVGKKKESEQVALEAIDLAQKENADSRSTRELLLQLKSDNK